ncbi:hypothetical protein K6U21_15330 [Vibrio vulnificus]|uniref:hypothetical protein n=1 Tax=Vibrio vulnificus TaxID=672 RepID=UPI001EEB93DD|nr:hypothetical protein [Vibrio vulnificus]MCG6305533.1 hypothetical protein [Vibrio vulnificus]
MYEKFVAKDKDVFATPLFITSITIPLMTAIGIGLGIHYSIEFSEFLSNIWATMKLPIAIASLSLPLATWVIANHRSAQITKANKLLESKRLIETYLEQESFFERVYGRKITTANWQFITKDDLPVIHAELYEFQRLHEKGHIKPKESLSEDIQQYFDGTRKCFWEFYEYFVEEKRDTNNEYLLESLTIQLFEFLHRRLAVFSGTFGTRNIDLNETKLGMYITAYFEIYYLCVDLNLPTGGTTNEILSEDYETFNAVVNLIYERFGNGQEDTNLSTFRESLEIKRMVKFAVSEPHVQTINKLIHDWSENFSDNYESMKLLPFDDAYLGFKLFTHTPDDAVIMSFMETDEKEYFGELRLEKDAEIVFMPIFKEDTKIRLHKDAQAAQQAIGEILSFLSKHFQRN